MPQDADEKKKEPPKKKEKVVKEAPKEGTPVKLKKTSKKYKLYEVSGDKLTRKNKFCPKCGPGVFLAKHKDRLTCGKCGYSEVLSKEAKEAPKKEEKKK